MATAGASKDRWPQPIVIAAIAGAVLLAAAAVAWLVNSPGPAKKLEAMHCRELAAEILDGSQADRRAALAVYVRKKCI